MAHPHIDHDKLHGYLSGHLLGSYSGLHHFKAARDTWAGTAYEERFASLWKQVEADQEDLKLIMDQLGFTYRIAARLGAPVAMVAGWINPFNPLRIRKLSAAQVQLDVLTGLLNAKLRMWQSLLLMVEYEPRLNAELMRDLEKRAKSQIAQITSLSDETWQDRFAPDEHSDSPGDRE